jgi:chromosome partitioning protein
VPAIGTRKLFQERGFSYPKLNIAFQMLKGGVGKTSLSFSLAVRAAQYGTRVLAVDLDMQGNLTRSFNIDTQGKPVLLNLIRDKLNVEAAITKVADNLHVLPSSLNNSSLEVELTQSSRNLRDLIKDLLSPIREDYDIVIFDCPPAINKTNTSATCASDLIIIPLNPDTYAIDGLDQTIAELQRIKEDFKTGVDYLILWNKYDAREKLAPVYMHQIAKDDNKVKKLLPIVIRVDTALKNAVFDAKSIFELPKRAHIREDIDQFTKEILGINRWRDTKSANDSAK